MTTPSPTAGRVYRKAGTLLHVVSGPFADSHVPGNTPDEFDGFEDLGTYDEVIGPLEVME